MRLAVSIAASEFSSTPSDPGRIGTPASLMIPRAQSFTPIARITAGVGPMNLMPEISHTSAKPAFSLKNP